MEEISYLNVALVPIILGIVSAIKAVGVPSKWAPVISIALGVGILGFIDGFTGTSFLMGIGTGLAASGLYSGAKAVVSK